MGDVIPLERQHCTSAATTTVSENLDNIGRSLVSHGLTRKNLIEPHTLDNTEPTNIHYRVPWRTSHERDVSMIGEVNFDSNCTQLYFSQENISEIPKLLPTRNHKDSDQEEILSGEHQRNTIRRRASYQFCYYPHL